MALRTRPSGTKDVEFQSREYEPLVAMMLREPEYRTYLGLQANIVETNWYNPLRRDPAFNSPHLPGGYPEGKQNQNPDRFKGPEQRAPGLASRVSLAPRSTPRMPGVALKT